MYPLIRSLFYAIVVLSLDSCTTIWEKTPITIEEAVGVGRVKITTGTRVTLEEAINIDDKLLVVFKNDNRKIFDYVINYENHYFGFVEAEFDSLNSHEISSIFIVGTLSAHEYEEVILVEHEGYFGEFKDFVKIDTSSIVDIRQIQNSLSRDESKRRTMDSVLITILILLISIPLLALMYFRIAPPA